jgi:hypothetical protein
MQTKLIIGDSLNVLDTYADYPASAGWVLKYRFVPRVSGTAIQLTAAPEGDSYRTSVASSITKDWTPGDYSWAKWVERESERKTLASGEITFQPDPAALDVGTDTRSHLEKTIANIEAMIEGRATKDVQEYTIADRQLKHIPITELLIWRDKYKAQLAGERAAKSLTKGTGLGRKILVRL